MPESAIRLLVGLGNPGPEYEATRHNAGFWLADLIAEQNSGKFAQESKFHGLLGRMAVGCVDLRLLKPMTFMNCSGRAVAAVANYFDIAPEQILVAHDDLDIPSGQARLKFGGGNAGHNGLHDIASVMGTQDFWRMRIGIDRPKDRSPVVGYVLGLPSSTQVQLIESALDQVCACLPDIVAGRFAQAMKQLHTQQPK